VIARKVVITQNNPAMENLYKARKTKINTLLKLKATDNNYSGRNKNDKTIEKT
jgi:hypothetical protein